MNIEDAIHVIVDDIIDHLMHSLHPCLIDIAILVHVVEPSHRHANCSKASILHHGHQLRLCLVLTPVDLRVKILLTPVRSKIDVGAGCSIGIECITKIPAHTHVLDSLGSGFCNLCLQGQSTCCKQ